MFNQARLKVVVSSLILLICAGAGEVPKSSVVILGGGVGGMSAAQELVDRGYHVIVLESKSIAGGKARSMGKPGSGTDGRKDLPGEHGFRFFPGFYRHITDTMKRIPFGAKTVFDNLVEAPRIHLASTGKFKVEAPAGLPKNWKDLMAGLRLLLNTRELKISHQELAFFAKKLYILATSSDERRFGEYEKLDWWEFIEAEKHSPQYQKYLATGLMRNLVAARPQDVSARTGGVILLRLIYSIMGQGEHVDRLLNGPTNEVWIDPWLEHLKSRGVEFEFDAKVSGLEFEDGRVIGVRFESGGVERMIEADHFIGALPVEKMRELLPEAMKKADPQLAKLDVLRVEWMTGIQFFLDTDVRIANGHSIYFDSPWALTSVSQKQFWRNIDLEKYGDGSIRGVLSVDISDWDKPGILYGKPARACSAEEIKNEVLAQLKAHLKPQQAARLELSLVTWMLDPGIKFPEPGKTTNDEPLLINTQASWENRPEAVTGIKNFFLASDYVKTNTDLATMEAANEAARRAVNGILDADHSKHERAKIWNFEEPAVFGPAKFIDRLRMKMGLPHWLERAEKFCQGMLTRIRLKPITGN